MAVVPAVASAVFFPQPFNIETDNIPQIKAVLTTEAKESSAEETKAEEEGQVNQEKQDPAAIVPVTVDYSHDGDWKDQKTLFFSKVAQIKLLDNDHKKLQDVLKALNQSALDDQKMTRSALPIAIQQAASENAVPDERGHHALSFPLVLS